MKPNGCSSSADTERLFTHTITLNGLRAHIVYRSPYAQLAALSTVVRILPEKDLPFVTAAMLGLRAIGGSGCPHCRRIIPVVERAPLDVSIRTFSSYCINQHQSAFVLAQELQVRLLAGGSSRLAAIKRPWPSLALGFCSASPVSLF